MFNRIRLSTLHIRRNLTTLRLPSPEWPLIANSGTAERELIMRRGQKPCEFPIHCWRGDRRHLDVAAGKGGLFPSGDEKSVDTHMRCSLVSHYVSTTTTFDQAAKFSSYCKGRYIYLLNIPPVFVDMPFILKRLYVQYVDPPYLAEQELAAFGAVPFTDIYAMLSRTYKVEILLNHDYRRRNWAIEILSGSEKESCKIQDMLDHEETNRSSERYLKPSEAIEIKNNLSKEFSHVSSRGDRFILFNTVPRNLSSAEAVNYVARKYYDFSKTPASNPRQHCVVNSGKGVAFFKPEATENSEAAMVKKAKEELENYHANANKIKSLSPPA